MLAKQRANRAAARCVLNALRELHQLERARELLLVIIALRGTEQAGDLLVSLRLDGEAPGLFQPRDFRLETLEHQ